MKQKPVYTAHFSISTVPIVSGPSLISVMQQNNVVTGISLVTRFVSMETNVFDVGTSGGTVA